MKTRLFSVIHSGRMIDHRHKLKREKFRLARRNFHSKHSQAVTQDAQRGCTISALGIFKTKVDKALNNLAWPEMLFNHRFGKAIAPALSLTNFKQMRGWHWKIIPKTCHGQTWKTRVIMGNNPLQPGESKDHSKVNYFLQKSLWNSLAISIFFF